MLTVFQSTCKVQTLNKNLRYENFVLVTLLRCYPFVSLTFQKLLSYSVVSVFVVTGADGKVEESMELMKEVEDLKQKKRMAEVGRGMPISFIQSQQLM